MILVQREDKVNDDSLIFKRYITVNCMPSINICDLNKIASSLWKNIALFTSVVFQQSSEVQPSEISYLFNKKKKSSLGQS